MSNIKFEIAKAKILFSSEDQEEKQQALKIFASIFNNPNNELKYRLEALGFLAENLYSLQETYIKLLEILTKEEIDEIKSSVVIRKIKEIGGQEDLKNWIINEVLNNKYLPVAKRYYILKSSLETLEIDMLQLVKDKDPDFFNILLLLKDRKDVVNLLIEKVKQSSYLDKLVYLNILYTFGYKPKEVINYLLSQDIDSYFLILLFSYYFNDLKIYQKVIQKFEEENRGILNMGILKTFVYHFVFSLNNKKPSFLNINPPLNESFHKIIYSILTRDNKIIEAVIQEINQNYSGLYLTILSKYMYKLGLTDMIIKEDISEIESEYLSMEDAMIEINSSKYNISLFNHNVETQEYVKSDSEHTESKHTESEYTEAPLMAIEEEIQEKDKIISVINQMTNPLEMEKEKNKEKYIDIQVVKEIEQIVESIIKEDYTNETQNQSELENLSQIEQYIKNFLDNKIEEVDQKILTDFYIQDKEKFLEIIEKYALDDEYIKNNFNKIIKILEICKNIDEFSVDLLLKSIIQIFFENELFDKLAQIFKNFKITNKINFYKYISKNDLITWDKNMQEKLSKFINFLIYEDKFETLSKEEVGIVCVYILEGQFEEIKQSIGKILEEIYS